MAISKLEEGEKRCLVLILRRQKAMRSPYIAIQLLRSIPNYRSVVDSLHRKGLVSYYKSRRAVGLTEDGYYTALALMEEGY